MHWWLYCIVKMSVREEFNMILVLNVSVCCTPVWLLDLGSAYLHEVIAMSELLEGVSVQGRWKQASCQ